MADRPEPVRQDGIGVPDHLARLWTPHRMAYVTGGSGTDKQSVKVPGTDQPGTDQPGTDQPGTDQPGAGAVEETAPTCPFCRIPTLPDEDGLIVARGEKVYAVLNLFPYNPGHLMVLPFRHMPDYTDLDTDELTEFSAFTRRALTTIRAVSAPHGFNLGINAGSAAGAGIAEHLHQHVVPRWRGDSNFMPVVGQTKVLPQLLADTRRLLAQAW